jgi:hypothetical protein
VDTRGGRPSARRRGGQHGLQELAKGEHLIRRGLAGPGTAQTFFASGQPRSEISRGGQRIDGSPAPQAEGVGQLEGERDIHSRHLATSSPADHSGS